jgi:hypothetical protein
MKRIPLFVSWLVVVAAISFATGYVPVPWAALLATFGDSLTGSLSYGAVMGAVVLSASAVVVLFIIVGSDIDRRSATTVLPWLVGVIAVAGIVAQWGPQGWLFAMVAAVAGYLAAAILPAASLVVVPIILQQGRWNAGNAVVLLVVHAAGVLASMGTARPISSTDSGWWLDAAAWAYIVLAALAMAGLFALRRTVVLPRAAADTSWFASLVEGWRHIAQSRSLVALIIASALVLAATGLMSKMFYRMLAGTPAMSMELVSRWAMLTAGCYLAGIACVIAIPALLATGRAALLVLSIATVTTVYVALYPALQSAEFLIAASAMLSACTGAWLPLRATLLQHAMPDAMRGRCAVALVIAEGVTASLLVLIGAWSVVGACILIFLGASTALLVFWRYSLQRPVQTLAAP